MINVKTIPKNIKNFDEYMIRKTLTNYSSKEKINELYEVVKNNIISLEKENTSFKEVFNKINPILSSLEYGYVYNPKSKHCSNRIFEKNKKINDNIIYDIMINIIDTFNLKVIDNFKGYELEAIKDIINDIHKSMNRYSIISFTDKIPNRFELDKDYGKTYDLLHRFSVYYHSRLIREILEKEFSNIL